MYEKAVTLDPQYAEAYTWLGTSFSMDWRFRWNANSQNLEHAFTLGQKALALDDSLPGAHSLLSRVYTEKRQYGQALVEGEQAITLDPNNADSYAWQADGLNHAGRPEEALRMVEQALRLNPRYPSLVLDRIGLRLPLDRAVCRGGRHVEGNSLTRAPIFSMATSIWLPANVQQWLSQQNVDAQTLEQALAAARRSIALNDSRPVGSYGPGHCLSVAKAL